MKDIFPMREVSYNLRNKNPFLARNVGTVFNGTETLSFRGPKTWAIVPAHIKRSTTLQEFKGKIRNWEPKGCTCRLCIPYFKNIGFLEI